MNLMSLYQNLLNIKKLAIENNLNSIAGDLDCFIEKCYRYYSKTYHTELEKSYQLPIEQVVLIYMEDELSESTKEDLEELRKHFVTPEIFFEMPEKAEMENEVLDDEIWISKMNADLKKKEDSKKEQDQKKVIEDTHKAIEELTKSLTKLKVDEK